MCAAEQKALEAAQAAYADCHRVQRPSSPARATSRKIKRPTFPATAQAQRAQDQRSNSPKAARAASPRKASPVKAASPEPVKERGKGIDASVPLPMLAHDYNKRGKGALYPCFVQPKLDGTRCIGIPRKGLFSRMRKSFPHMEHIVAELNQLPADVILDGELYTDELTFQQSVGLVKRETLREGNAENQVKIKYHVYDMVSAGTFEERYAALTKLLRGHRCSHIVLVPTERCASEERMKAKHNEYVADGFEGIMLRNPAGLYKHSRSTDLLKYKEFIDEEFTVVGFTEGDGQDKGCVVWICETEEKKRFQCRPRGTKEERKEMFQNGDAYIGKKLTVRFQEWSDAHIPRFPVGIAFRDYE
jgi:DNA ligase-1